MKNVPLGEEGNCGGYVQHLVPTACVWSRRQAQFASTIANEILPTGSNVCTTASQKVSLAHH
jgi:hypothetical protein